MSHQAAPMHPYIAGYDFLRFLGKGATANVFLYRQQVTNREVAVKVSTRAMDVNERILFTNEAKNMAKVGNPYILSVFDAGVTDDGKAYLIVEYAPSGTLGDLIKKRRLTAQEAMTLGVNLASALYCAHRAGIVHRDIKPNNILINAQGNPAIADFGISTSVYDHSATGFSPSWAPPEVITGVNNGNEACDIYSLAATIYACLVGTSPYEYGYSITRTSHGRAQLNDAIINKPLPAINRPDVPKSFEDVLKKALSKNPDDRYYSALEFARALQLAQFRNYGIATPTSIEGVPHYPATLLQQQNKPHIAHVPFQEKPQRTWLKPLLITLAVLVVIGTVFACIILPRMNSHIQEMRVVNPIHEDAHSSSPHTDADDTAMLDNQQVPSPINVEGRVQNDNVIFTWTNPDPQDGDQYAWSTIDPTGGDHGQVIITSRTSITVPPTQSGPTCIQVSIVREDRSMSTNPTTACVNK